MWPRTPCCWILCAARAVPVSSAAVRPPTAVCARCSWRTSPSFPAPFWLQEEAAEFGAFIADQGAEQCGFCNPGFIMNALALFREKEYPTEEEIKEYLSGNLCRCSGYEGQLRGILNFLAWKKQKQEAAE